MPRLLVRLLLLLALLSHLPARSQDPPAWQEMAALPDLACIDAAPAPALLGQRLRGRWHGHLLYRDFGSGKGVTLPTEVSIEDAGSSVRLAFVYDDGPGKTVRSTEQWSLGADGATLSMGKEKTPLALAVYRGNQAGDLALVALGSGIDNDVPVEVRSVVLRRGDTLTISRATRAPQGPWLLRHVYRLTPAP